MTREEIEKTNHGKLTDFKGHKQLLVSFGGIQQALGIPVFEFFNSISDIPCDKIFFRDFHQQWYQKGVDSELNHIDKITDYLKKVIAQNDYNKVCFLGNSMGGYAAILFGSILNIDTVIAFAPQSYIDRFNRFINSDKRWLEQISQVHSYKNKKSKYFDLKKHLSKLKSYKTEIHIYYSPNYSLDKKHAERLKRKKNVILHSIQKGGHSIVVTARDNGILKSAIKASFGLKNTDIKVEKY